ncbi:MAG: HAD-IC family P-type ATPase, partial [Conexivisphaerales archaeon]|nr:HAD-IC family P-type ATPase [Conexivisphaerales archaeon]
LKLDHRVVVATGDSSASARSLGELLGVEVRAGLLPDEKVELVKRLRQAGPVAFVGDGINDAVALREADVGIAISSGTDIAKYAGDMVIRSPSSIPYLLSESRLAVRKVKENLAWAFGYNTALVPVAAGLFYPAIYIAPQFAALAMSMSSVFVSLWSLVRRRSAIRYRNFSTGQLRLFLRERRPYPVQLAQAVNKHYMTMGRGGLIQYWTFAEASCRMVREALRTCSLILRGI